MLDPVRDVRPEAAGHRTHLDRGDSLIFFKENDRISPFLVAVPLRFHRQSATELHRFF